MSRTRKYPKTNGYWVYCHVTPEHECYFGVSKQQPCDRWKPSLYKGMSLEPYIERFGWDNIEHLVIQDNLTKEQALKLEDWFITNATENGFCINKQRSGLIRVSDVNAYKRKLFATNEQYREKRNIYNKQYFSSIEGKIYRRVANYNRNHTPIETAKEARDKYIATGSIPSYIKSDDLV